MPHFLARRGRTGSLIPHFLHHQPCAITATAGSSPLPPVLAHRCRNKPGAAPVTLSVVTESAQLDPKTEFRQLYDQEFLSVYRSIRGAVLDSAAAEDLTQETFVRPSRA